MGTTNTASSPRIVPRTPPRPAPDRYGIVLATFPGAGSAEAATSLRLQLAPAFPGLASKILLHERRNGWVVAFGDYTGFDDPRARQDIEMIRRLRGPRGNQLFPQVLLTRFRAPRAMSDLHPLDLWSVRQEYPDIDPLYTLDIAIWGDFESGQWSASKRRSARRAAAEEMFLAGPASTATSPTTAVVLPTYPAAVKPSRKPATMNGSPAAGATARYTATLAPQPWRAPT